MTCLVVVAMRWVSTPESVKDGEASALAVAETILAVAAYWGIAWAFDTHVHLLVSILVAPLLLLRSPESTKLGVEMFEAFWTNKTEVTRHGTPKRLWLVVLLSGGSGAAISLGLYTFWLPEASGLTLFWRSPVTGLVAAYVAGAIVVSKLRIDKSDAVLLVLAAPGAIGIWLRSLMIRFTATIYYVISGLRRFSSNWWYTLFVVDSMYPPELVPDAISSSVIPSFSDLISIIRKSDSIVRAVFFAVIVIIIFAPAIFYRWSLKSTCWLYFSLAYLAWPHAESKERDRVWVSLLHRGRMEDFSRIAALLVVISVVVSTFLVSDWAALRNAFPQAPTLMYLLAFDLGNLAPWQWGGVASAVLTGIVWGVSDKAHRSYELTGAADRSDLTVLRLVTRLRTVITLVTLGVSLGYAVLALKGIDPNQLPGWLSFATWLYGPYLPVTPAP